MAHTGLHIACQQSHCWPVREGPGWQRNLTWVKHNSVLLSPPISLVLPLNLANQCLAHWTQPDQLWICNFGK